MAQADTARFRPGLRTALGKQAFSADQLNQVLLSMREKTGWHALAFDEDGFLVCPDPQIFNGGSAAARRLLGEALFGDAAYELESHHRSPQVKFARLANGTDYVGHSKVLKISAYPIQIDFSDFRHLRGEGPVLKAFDPGFSILHELAHAVWRLPDVVSEGEEPGECERYITRIRRELHLPERQHYEAGARTRANRPQLIAELRFIRFSEKHGQLRRERFFLLWDAEMVGALAERSLTAGLR